MLYLLEAFASLQTGEFLYLRFALSLNKIGCTSIKKIKTSFLFFIFGLHYLCTQKRYDGI